MVFLTDERVHYWPAMDKTIMNSCSQSKQKKRADRTDTGCRTSSVTAAFCGEAPRRLL